MKIEFKKARECPYGQFVVFPESEIERVVIENFLEGERSEDWKIHIHGHCYNSSVEGVTSFNFGLIRTNIS